jgi:hypothetical protein
MLWVAVRALFMVSVTHRDVVLPFFRGITPVKICTQASDAVKM